MNQYWWILFSINFLFSAGIMLTYISRGKGRTNYPAPKEVQNSGSRTLVIVPVKGVDFELDKNLASIRDQNYGPFDLIAVVDSEEDPAIEYLKKEGIRYIESTEKCNNCSGKVRAIYSAFLRYTDYEYYVIVDSDVRARRTWLADLLRPLLGGLRCVTTTFPIFYPEGGFWSKFKMFWGLVGQSMMESNLTRFVWGGSMAFSKDLLDEKSLEAFSRAISDDIAILRIAREKGLEIVYVPESRPTIHSNEDYRAFMEWSNRQTAFSIYSTNKTFIFGMVYYAISIYLLLSSIILAVTVNALFAVFLFPFFFNSFNSQRKVPVKVWYFLAITFILPFIYVWNLTSGFARRRVVWRGNAYSLAKDQ